MLARDHAVVVKGRKDSSAQDLESQVAAVDEKLDEPEPSTVRFQPNLAELYRQKVADLADTFADPEIRTEAIETIRGLIDRITVRFDEAGTNIELDGALAAMIDLAQNAKSPARAGRFDKAVASATKVVAGTGFGLCRTSVVI